MSVSLFFSNGIVPLNLSKKKKKELAVDQSPPSTPLSLVKNISLVSSVVLDIEQKHTIQGIVISLGLFVRTKPIWRVTRGTHGFLIPCL